MSELIENKINKINFNCYISTMLGMTLKEYNDSSLIMKRQYIKVYSDDLNWKDTRDDWWYTLGN